ncbi:MAG: ribonuclease D [Mariprofundaceae bacterium]|nr:ribonuclease D [Mariprofundaceae bacterium]
MMANNQTVYVNTPVLLQTACLQLQSCTVICVDTEFHRETTYSPEFALLQAYAGGRCWLFDPLEIDDLSPLWTVLCDPAITKVFHAGRQDLEILLLGCGTLPLPVFDTQVAASLLGYGQQIGFANLVQRVMKKNLPKQESYSDWMARPLRQQQLDYAADDVIWLMPVYQSLKEQLEARGRLPWLDQEQHALCTAKNYAEDIHHVFWRVKGVNRLRGRSLAVLRELAAWREAEARKRNLPRRRMLQDEALLEIARRDHLDVDVMMRMRGLTKGLLRRFGDQIITAWQRGMDCNVDDWPKHARPLVHAAGTDMRMALMDTMIRLKSEDCDVAASILVRRSELSKLASWGSDCNSEPPTLQCLSHWRYDLVGHDLLRLLRGEICLCLDTETGMPKITEMPPSDASS